LSTQQERGTHLLKPPEGVAFQNLFKRPLALAFAGCLVHIKLVKFVADGSPELPYGIVEAVANPFFGQPKLVRGIQPKIDAAFVERIDLVKITAET